MKAWLVGALVLLACGAKTKEPTDAGPFDAGVPDDAGAPDAGTPDGGGANDAGSLNVVAYPRLGAAADDTRVPRGPGLILMGGGSDVDDAFVWAHDVIAGDAGTPAQVGDVVVLRASGSNGYDPYLAGLAPFNSVQTLRLPPTPSLTDLRYAADVISHAELVFIAGGNQADYVPWKGSPLSAALQDVYAHGGVVGGTSAGLAVLGQYVFDAVDAGTASVVTADVVADPYNPLISFTTDFLQFPALSNTITDTHFVTRDRFGRLAGFMARQIADGRAATDVVGLGVDEASAIVVDRNGVGHLLMQGSFGAAFIIHGGPPDQVSPGLPLKYLNLSVMRLSQLGDVYDFTRHCGTGITYAISVDGTQSTAYSSDPYTTAGELGTCP